MNWALHILTVLKFKFKRFSLSLLIQGALVEQDLSDGETFIITINVVAGLREQRTNSVRAVQREARKRREKPTYTTLKWGANNSTEQIQL